jgi:adenylate cyclase
MTGPEPTRVDLERAILGEEPTLTAAEVVAQSGASVEVARRVWRALGFPEYDDEAAFTGIDAQVLRSLNEEVSAGRLDLDTALKATRALGTTMARLAEWEVATLLPAVDDASGPGMGRAQTGMAFIEQMSSQFEDLLLYAWRRHLAAAVARIGGLDGSDDGTTTEVTVGFADIVSFTALSNEMDEDRIGDLVEVFETRCHDVIAAHRGRAIKSLGDSVLFVNDDPVRAIKIAEGIIDVIGRDARLPDVRLGLASGSVVLRQGDVYGPPVNLAARLTAVARRNRVIIDKTTASMLPASLYETRKLPARPLRGFGLVEPITVRRH